LSFNSYEGQIDVGKMMRHLLKLVYAKDIMVLNGLDIQSYQALNSNVDICCHEFSFKAKHLLLATNAFAQILLNLDLKPARNQVLVTKPIKNLQLQGTFHLNEGYYYFRNIDQRILLGGGRHLDIQGETTEEFGTTTPIMTALEKLLKNTILPQTTFEIDQVWSGILGVGSQKQPIVKSINHSVHCAVRLGGMGVAIGSEVGRQLAELP
jgi:glycine/D-amino acid oxidase-like deaminating enzyme